MRASAPSDCPARISAADPASPEPQLFCPRHNPRLRGSFREPRTERLRRGCVHPAELLRLAKRDSTDNQDQPEESAASHRQTDSSEPAPDLFLPGPIDRRFKPIAALFEKKRLSPVPGSDDVLQLLLAGQDAGCGSMLAFVAQPHFSVFRKHSIVDARSRVGEIRRRDTLSGHVGAGICHRRLAMAGSAGTVWIFLRNVSCSPAFGKGWSRSQQNPDRRTHKEHHERTEEAKKLQVPQ